MYDEIEDDRGYKYFINREGVRMRESPLLINIIKTIKSNFCDIKYNTYRCVLKLKNLKKFLSTYCISYRVVVSIIEKHKKGSTSQQIAPRELTDIVSDIFFATEKAGFYEDNKNFRLETAVSILTNFLWNIFDIKRTQNITMMEFQLTMLILCELDPFNTFHQIMDSHFDIVKDFNHCITKARFEEFINIFNKILSYIGEPLYFEQKLISDILTEAFVHSPGFNGINQFTFYNLWTNHQIIKFSAYTNLFLLMIRFKKSEGVIHQTECAGCKKFPIIGLRYKCQKCKRFSLCFNCFSKGFTNKRHSRGHRFYELTSVGGGKESKWYDIFRKFINVFKRSASAATPSIRLNAPNGDANNTKLIEDEHIELVQIDDDMEGGTTAVRGRQRRGTIRSEIFNNSENLLILQRNLMDKLLATIDALKNETESFQKMSLESQQNVQFLQQHGLFLCEQIEVLKQIHEATCQSISSTQNNKTIKSFSSPSKSIFLPSSTPYTAQEKPKLMVDPILCKSINGYELNKSFVAKNEEYSISDLSTFFQTKVPTKVTKNGFIDTKTDETVTKIDNFKYLLKQVKEIIDDSFTDNVELARTTEMFSKALDQIIEVEEEKKKHNRD